MTDAEREAMCQCTDNKWESICDYCFLQSARLQGNEVYRKGLLRAAECLERLKILRKMWTIKEIQEAIRKEAEGGEA